MFKVEKDMIPVLQKFLSERYKTEYFVSEFDSGNGIADLVFSFDMDTLNEKELLLDYEALFLIHKYLNRKNKKVYASKFKKKTSLEKKKFDYLFKKLVEMGILEALSDETYVVREKYAPPVKKIFSIEAKLHDWKNGFYQALRYKAYSHKSYLAISEEFAHRVDLELLRENNIGLIAVSPNGINFILDIKIEKPQNPVANAYLSEKFLRTFI